MKNILQNGLALGVTEGQFPCHLCASTLNTLNQTAA